VAVSGGFYDVPVGGWRKVSGRERKGRELWVVGGLGRGAGRRWDGMGGERGDGDGWTWGVRGEIHC
jgi:hypothetical protein